MSEALLTLLAVPVAACALSFGVRGGLVSAAAAAIAAIAIEMLGPGAADVLAWAAPVASYLAVGALVGGFADRGRAQARKHERRFDLSLDLFGTAGFDGYFLDLNPAWERVLGHTVEELRSRPLLEFVHPDDVPTTQAELERLAEGMETINFRNRYRTADGDYRWLDWNAHPETQSGEIHATARDITAQVEAEETLRTQSETLEETVRARTHELEQSRLEILQRLAITAEFRDDDTHQHTERVGRTAARIARQLGFDTEDVELIRRAAPLHDIGKVGVPDAVLWKPGLLTEDEFEVMKTHVEIGAKILAQGRFPVLNVARTIALSHHERWDGTGYPYGLGGEDIPLVGRITAVADVFDALTHARPYKPAWTIAAAVKEILAQAGKQLDPEVVAAFLRLDHARLLHPVRAVRAPGPTRLRTGPRPRTPA
ncbi:MAG: HD domain-containing protein [Actinomycetota bacterium]|nr:HD domain-containing protein [Actinomycetota bacterium]